MNRHNAAAVAVSFAAIFWLVAAGAANAGFTFLGPSQYLSAADSPFDLSGLGSTFFLEDFEDLVPQPGIGDDPNFPGDPILEIIRQMGSSVDADDGVIDNSGFAGYSGGPIEEIDAGLSRVEIVRFHFDSMELGFLPTAVGLVLTDGAGPNSGFTAFSSGGDSASIDTSDLMLTSLTTSDDRFIGVINPAGITRVEFAKGTFGGGAVFPLIDHLQYGLFVPEPNGMVLLILGATRLLTTRLRRSVPIASNS